MQIFDALDVFSFICYSQLVAFELLGIKVTFCRKKYTTIFEFYNKERFFGIEELLNATS